MKRYAPKPLRLGRKIFEGKMQESPDGPYVLFADVESDLATLRALEAAGVDNWSGYDLALENFDG